MDQTTTPDQQVPSLSLLTDIGGLTDGEIIALAHDWRLFARPAQIAPPGDWRTWLFRGGRGAGKTLAGAQWIREQVKMGAKRLGLVAPTAADARDVMVEGESGLLSVCWAKDVDYEGNRMGRPIYEPSKRRVGWLNGAVAHLYSAEEPDRLRGPQHSKLWCDELAAWPSPKAKDGSMKQHTWDMALFGLRLGDNPQVLVTTTPRPSEILLKIAADPTTVTTVSTTYENRHNLAPAFFSQIIKKYEGTRMGRQELMAEILEESDEALWTRDMIERSRIPHLPIMSDGQPLQMRRVVIAIDPAVSTKATSNLTGIVAVGLGVDGRGYVLADGSGKYSPHIWASKVMHLFKSLKADRIVAEGNQGGDLVRSTLMHVLPNAPITIVHATRGKQARAEPIAALYEQNKISHVGSFVDLEDQLCVAGDTEISTARGQIAIKDLKHDDFVLTRAGYSPIKWVGKTGIKPTLIIKTSLGFHVRLSYNHPVFIGNRFVRADELKVGDIVTECHKNPYAIASNLRAKNITDGKENIFAQVGHAVANYCMSQFGKVDLDLCQKAKNCITSILINPIMNSATSNVLLAKNMSAGTPLEAHSFFHSKSEVRCDGRSGGSGSRVWCGARFAKMNFRRQGSDQSFAIRPVVKSSTIVAIEKADSIPLWDLTVDGLPEFFANGILVHNCTWEPLSSDPSPDRLDALVWGLTALMLQQPAQAAFGVYGQE